ncbi:Stp1/IreP family PP2C-type Ser/Thr phosphatase [Mechercharimyces sp. CAU 1602]|uniref:Stp1/IreP family PP2C-type Ser/Thr phosphatase n=1 Tax=Mechercharimyces sp. CAU 1602 TaxID=2973933 RepID=UPI0021630607|nr:Stp1/IreP family PP2C-type Ser/Thr phosphatase [Mechercharimyces sp. CAU 1602]MCS1351389.1 Stp1/IreP family PP2C-type Ser/Thr phosphatase [Mechercharimyces sp. CAU 1602]
MEMAWRTHTGKVRDHNEDRVGLFETQKGLLVAVVADGMGGHQAGEIASQQVVDVVKRELAELTLDAPTVQIKRRLEEAVKLANREVYQMAEADDSLKGMGTTAIVAVVREKEIVLAHVGDSRAYLLHRGGLYQLTEDHTLVNELKKHGEITEEEALHHPQKNIIVKAIGTDSSVEPDLVTTPWSHGDTLLLCSDGLVDMVKVNQIGKTMTSERSIAAQADHLLEHALAAGGVDNISLILVNYKENIDRRGE